MPPVVRLSSFTRNLSQTNGHSWQYFDTNGAVAARWDGQWVNRNTVNWSLSQGGTERAADGWVYSWSPQAPPNSYAWDTSYTLVWPAAPGTGTQTNVYHSGHWVLDSDLSTYYYTNSYSTNGYGGIPQPSYPWVHVASRVHQFDLGDTNNPSHRLLWTNDVSETAQARIELLTGGEPGATNVMFHSLWFVAYPASGGGIDPGEIVVAGQSAEPGGRIVLALAANSSQDITPTLPVAYSNYHFWVYGPVAWSYAVVAVATDQWYPSVGSNVTFTALMNDTGPTPPIIEWLVNGVTNTSSTTTTLTCAFTNAGTYTVTARCAGTEASTTLNVTFRGTLTLVAGALDIGVGSAVTFTASATPTVTPDFATWSGPQSYRITPPATNEAWYPDLNGGFTKTFYFEYPDYSSDSSGQPVTLTCGDSTTNQYIRVYAVQAVTASTNIVAVTSNAQFAAVLNRDGPNVPPIQWYVNGALNTNFTGTNLDYTFPDVGSYTIEAWLGSSRQSNTVTVAFAGQINLTANATDIRVGELVDFSATLNPVVTPTAISWAGDTGALWLLDLSGLPYFANFPADAAGLLTCTVLFPSAGEKTVSITCDNGTTNKTIRVYEVTSVTASDSLVVVGSNVTFTATLNPPGGNPPPLQWFVNGTLNTNFTGTNLTWLMTNAGPLEVKAKCGISEVPVTVTGEFRGTINLAASAEDIGVSSNVTFTASLTPAVTAENLVWNGPQVWKILAPPSFGMMWPDFAGGFTKEFTFDYAGEYPVTVICGTSSASKTIRVYAVTAVMASDPLVPVGSNLTFTATVVGGTNPPPLTWFVDGNMITNTSLTATITFTNAGDHTVSATCGTSSNNVAITAVGVKRIESLTPDAKGVFAPSPLFVLKGNAIQFRAIPDPTNAAWPTGMPTWQIEGASVTNAEPNWSFQNQSTSTNDTKLVIAKCGTSTGTNLVTVFAITLSTAPAVIANNYLGLTLAQRTNRSLANIYAEVTPSIPGLPLTARIASAVPDTTDKGLFTFASGDTGAEVAVVNMVSLTLTGNRYDCWYLAKRELSTDRNRDGDALKSQTVTFDVRLNQQPMGTAMVTVMGHFKWLIAENRKTDAVQFVNAKYFAGVASPTYDPNEEDYGATSPALNVTVGPLGIDGGENWVAAVLFHEQTHVNQGSALVGINNLGESQYKTWADQNFPSGYLTHSLYGAGRRFNMRSNCALEHEAWQRMKDVADDVYLNSTERDNTIQEKINHYGTTRLNQIDAVPIP